MVNDYGDIDRVFREKLGGHMEKPSPMAWKKLNERLSEKEQGKSYWLKIAASFLLLMGFVGLLWVTNLSRDEQINNLAQKEVIPEVTKEENPKVESIQEDPPAYNKEVSTTGTDSISAPKFNSSPSIKHPEKKGTEVIIPEANGLSRGIPLLLEVEELELPPLNTDLLIAEKEPVEQEIEVAYTVRIISNGISERPEKESLVAEIDDKIDRIGGLLNKVDQGFADLQDAKNDLFTSIIIKKQ